jgi:ammonia channel protein AmtB
MMKQWFTSLNGAIVLSVLTLLTEMWRGFLDAMFVFPEVYGDEGLMNIAEVVFKLLFAAWAWTLILAGRGSRGGLSAAFVINALVLIAVPVSWLLVYCPAACRADAGVFNLANTLNLVFGLLAAVALGIQIWQGRTREAAEPAQAVS